MENLVSLKNLEKYYSNKKVFITGHTGFKGAWLMSVLHILGAQVKGYALAPVYENGLFNILWNEHVAESVIADIRNKEKVKSELLSFEPDYIFHLAAQPLVRRSYQIPAETFDINVVGTANVLEALASLKKKCTAIIVTTDKVYENKEQHVLYNEEDPLGGYDPYSASKACAELVVSSFRNSFFNRNNVHEHHKAIASARAGNVIGGGDWSEDRLIPDIIRALKSSKVIEVRNPYSVRPWQHVLEPLGGYLLLAALLDANPISYSKAYNFGPLPEDHLPVKALVDSAIRIWQSGEWKDISSTDQPHEAGLLKLAIHRAAKELNWHPKLSASQAIEWTVNWYKQPTEQLAAFTFRQIQDYFSL